MCGMNKNRLLFRKCRLHVKIYNKMYACHTETERKVQMNIDTMFLILCFLYFYIYFSHLEIQMQQLLNMEDTTDPCDFLFFSLFHFLFYFIGSYRMSRILFPNTCIISHDFFHVSLFFQIFLFFFVLQKSFGIVLSGNRSTIGNNHILFLVSLENILFISFF